jgi:tetratricopeptide (TPR) repeat protein
VTKKKHKRSGWADTSPAALRGRIDRAVNEGRFQQALELAKQLHKDAPTPENRELLHTTYLGRARQLRQQGSTRDAITVLNAALQPPGLLPSWTEQIAEELAACGDARGALALVKGDGSPLDDRLLARVADAALQKGASARGELPLALQPDFDRILLGFQQQEAGQDEALRETLQGLGLRSPFLEWKLLLRGLAAFYKHDNERALENWQRLTHDRLPARLIAPLRFTIDKNYQLAQPHATQSALLRQATRLQGAGVVQQLRDLQQALVGDAPMGHVFRLAEDAATRLKQEAPQMLPRLASCLYWSLLQYGNPEDIPRYRRVFGDPADDPGMHRLQALGWERSGYLDEAHKEWQKFEKAVAGHPQAWPGEQAARVRALVWQHMGRNAASIPGADKDKDLPPFLRNHPDRPRPLKPSAEECFRKSLDLAPDQAETYEELFRHYRNHGQDAKAIKVGDDLLARFPDRVETLAELGELHLKRQEYARALTCFQQALKNNPLDRRLRGQVSTAHLYSARSFAEAGDFVSARREYQAALAMGDGDNSSVLCKWAACEFKAGDNTRGEELLQQATGQAGNELAVAYSMLIETIRLKLPAGYKTRFNNAFNEGLAAPPTGKAAAALAGVTASHHAAGVTYHGQKTHQKKVLDYLKKAEKVSYAEDELERLCVSLLELNSYRLTITYTDLGQKTFPKNPLFPFLQAQNELSRGPAGMRPWVLRPLLEKAQKLAQALPPDRKVQQLLDQIGERLRILDEMNPFGRMFRDDFDPFGDFYDEDEDEDYW